MSEKKIHQPSMMLEEQVENLESLGLIINDKEWAKSILNDISYFRLIKGFSLRLKAKNDKYEEGTTFEQIVKLYLFNARFRQLLFPEIEKVEVNLRCRMANYFSDRYGVLGYKDTKNFRDQKYYNMFINDIAMEVKRNSKAPFVKNFCGNYEDGDLPFYALVEILSFGTISKVFKNMQNTDKNNIAKAFGTGYTYFESWIESLSYVRNLCAHYGRLYNAKFSKTPKLYPNYRAAGITNNRVFGTLICLRYLLSKDKHWSIFVEELENLFDEYKVVDKTTMGFPEEWKGILLGNMAK